MITNLKHISQGFINATRSEFNLADPEIEELAIKRYEHCLQCKFISDNKQRCSKDKGGVCNCYLKAKTRSDSKCKYWQE